MSLEEGSSSMPKEWRYALSHPKDLILGDLEQGVKTLSSINLFKILLLFLKLNQKVLRMQKMMSFGF